MFHVYIFVYLTLSFFLNVFLDFFSIAYCLSSIQICLYSYLRNSSFKLKIYMVSIQICKKTFSFTKKHVKSLVVRLQPGSFRSGMGGNLSTEAFFRRLRREPLHGVFQRRCYQGSLPIFRA